MKIEFTFWILATVLFVQLTFITNPNLDYVDNVPNNIVVKTIFPISNSFSQIKWISHIPNDVWFNKMDYHLKTDGNDGPERLRVQSPVRSRRTARVFVDETEWRQRKTTVQLLPQAQVHSYQQREKSQSQERILQGNVIKPFFSLFLNKTKLLLVYSCRNGRNSRTIWLTRYQNNDRIDAN